MYCIVISLYNFHRTTPMDMHYRDTKALSRATARPVPDTKPVVEVTAAHEMHSFHNSERCVSRDGFTAIHG